MTIPSEASDPSALQPEISLSPLRESSTRVLRIATRASALALWQAKHVAQLIREAAPGQVVELVHVSTMGDRDLSESLSEMGGMGVFTREVQKVVLEHQADLAVHSLKDLPTDSVAGLVLAGIPRRAPRFDSLILPAGKKLANWQELPTGSRLGTGSLRRRAQLLHYRPDLIFLDIRGNIGTRLKKLDDGDYDAIVLAAAGLTRLELGERISLMLGPPEMYPAVGQAALGIECRVDDTYSLGLLQQISDPPTQSEVLAERACLRTLRAGCHAPVATLTEVIDSQLRQIGIVLTPNGRQRFEFHAAGPTTDPESIGEKVAQGLLNQGAAAALGR